MPLSIVFEKNDNFWQLKKKVKFLAIFWHSNGNFPEGQVRSEEGRRGRMRTEERWGGVGWGMGGGIVILTSISFLFGYSPICHILSKLSYAHLTLRKMTFECKKKNCQKLEFLAIFWHSNCSFPDVQMLIFVSFPDSMWTIWPLRRASWKVRWSRSKVR